MAPRGKQIKFSLLSGSGPWRNSDHCDHLIFFDFMHSCRRNHQTSRKNGQNGQRRSEFCDSETEWTQEIAVKSTIRCDRVGRIRWRIHGRQVGPNCGLHFSWHRSRRLCKTIGRGHLLLCLTLFLIVFLKFIYSLPTRLVMWKSTGALWRKVGIRWISSQNLDFR